MDESGGSGGGGGGGEGGAGAQYEPRVIVYVHPDLSVSPSPHTTRSMTHLDISSPRD